jgi:hypothetical protein
MNHCTLQEHLVAARLALWEADLAMAQGDLRRVAMQMDMASAHLTASRKQLLTRLPAARDQETLNSQLSTLN